MVVVDVGELYIDLSCSFLICIASLIHLSTLLLSLSMNRDEGSYQLSPHLRQPVRPETERRTTIRQTRSDEGSSRGRNVNNNKTRKPSYR